MHSKSTTKHLESFSFERNVYVITFEMWMIKVMLACLATVSYFLQKYNHILIFALKGSLGHVSFTNLKCEMFDRKFGKFEVCHIKAVNRTHKYIDLEIALNILPINNIMVSVLNF